MAVGLAWGRARGEAEELLWAVPSNDFSGRGEAVLINRLPCPIHLLGLPISLSFADGRYLAGAPMNGRTADESPCHQVTCNNAPRDIDGHQGTPAVDPVLCTMPAAV
jgi:hypothetical protein